MKATVIGAGPSGLYFAALLKKSDPAHEVTVLERNAPDATFGWGVVFSEETLGALRDADYPTYLEITDTFARWDAIDIRYRGETTRSVGHGFSAIARKQLLAILQRRCHELGVILKFGTEIDDVQTLAAQADLLVGADGVNSVARGPDRKTFGTSIEPQGCKYVWFGTDLVFDAFTFIFKDTEHGLFQVHAYPFDEHTSTFIVECPEPTWRRAGLDQMTEQQSIEFCEKLFADELGGHKLLSNKSIWLSFPLVRNKNWYRGNVVLLGDAAHTAHFTIGSGTKLAMEDAIALNQAIVAHGPGEAALVDYELERQPVVERFQQAAAESADYFGRVGTHRHLEPPQFVFNLLTRSGRISHANLTVRDPATVSTVDSWFAGGTPIAPPPMFARFELAGLQLPNRVIRTVRSPADLPDATRSGAGLVHLGPVAVSAGARISPDTPIAANLESTVDGVAVLLSHAGRRGSVHPPDRGTDIPLPDAEAWPILAPSALPYTPSSRIPCAMTADDMTAVCTDFVAATRKLASLGAALVELDMAHGYLLGSFLSPLTNRRADEFGGDLDARLRFPLQVLDAVREAWDGPLAVRLGVTDWARGGLSVDDGIAIARVLREHGVHLIHVAAGQTVPGGQPEYRRGYLTAISDRVRSEAQVATLVGGYLSTADEINTVVAAGRADLCVLEGGTR